MLFNIETLSEEESVQFCKATFYPHTYTMHGGNCYFVDGFEFTSIDPSREIPDQRPIGSASIHSWLLIYREGFMITGLSRAFLWPRGGERANSVNGKMRSCFLQYDKLLTCERLMGNIFLRCTHIGKSSTNFYSIVKFVFISSSKADL